MNLLRGCLISVLLFAQPLLAAPQPDAERLRAWKVAAVAVLSSRGDANSLATAALLSVSGGPQLAARASELAPDSEPLAWVNLRLCATTAGCDFRDAATAMRWVDADNAAAWLPTLAVAQRDRDMVETERILFDMSQGKYANLYTMPVAVLMFDALNAVAESLPRDVVTSDATRLELVLAIAGARLVPSFTPLEEACREPAAGTERRDACVKIAHKLQRGDTLGGEIAGLMIEKHLVPPEAREHRLLGERRHALEAQMAAARRYDAPLLPWVWNAHARWHLARMRTLHRETDVMLAILREQGAPASAPSRQ